MLGGLKLTLSRREASKLKELTMHTHQRSSDPVATIGLDIGKTTFHLVGLDKRGAMYPAPAWSSCGSWLSWR